MRLLSMVFPFVHGNEDYTVESVSLIDYSVTDYIHVESTVSLAVQGVTALIEAADVEKKGHMFTLE